MTEPVKKKRGRPRKNPLPEEIQSLIEEVKEKREEIQQQIKQEESDKIESREGEWDVKIGDEIPYFDKRLSYEHTGYKPITETEGLDFNPKWFTEARDTFLKTGHYTTFFPGSKAYKDFWNLEYKRCKNGLTVNGYTITGFNYYFLNYYQLPNTDLEKAGDSRSIIFPNFFTYLYEFFHYFELCRVLKRNGCLMKNRGCGASEMTASIFDDFFNCFKNSICLLTAFDSNYVEKTLDKIWNGISFTDDNTDGGMLKLRQVINTNTKKRSTHYKVVNGQKIEVGFGSLIEGIVVDKDRKMRGDRVGFLFLEESGSNPILERSFIKAEELVTVGGNKIGIILAAGTGGDSGPALQGLNKVYYNPDDFLVLPFHHNYTETGDWVTTGFFMPAYITMNKRGYTGERGEYLLEKLKEFYTKRRESFKDPQTLLSYKAEQCFTAEEAFAAEGVNKFNKVKLSDLIIRIRIKLEKPQIQRGYMQFTYKDGSRNRNSISGVKFIPKTDGPVYVLQPPLWEITYDREPDETQEAFEERKKNEQSDGTLISEKISNLYVAGIDGIDIGQSETSSETRNPSKFCTMIKRRIYGNKEPEYVAYYIDRPNDIREAYKQTIGLLMWYNCLANLEATRMSVLTYARDNHFMLYFMRRPRSCFSDMTKRRSVNLYGTTATTPMIDHQTLLIADYIEDYSHNIWFIDLLDLLMKYTDENKGKFDMVAAMAMAEVGDEELNDILPKKVEVIAKEFQDIGYYIDERGYRRFGVIPKVRLVEVKARWDLYDGRNVTSDPRYR